MNTVDPNMESTAASNDRAAQWLSLSCSSTTATNCSVSDLAAQDLGRRTGMLPLATPLAMSAFLVASPQLLPYWPPVALLFLILLGAALVRIHLGRKLLLARSDRAIDLARDYQGAVDLTGFCWGSLVGVLLLVHGIDRLTEIALVATLGMIAGGFTTLTVERTLWMHFSFAIWLPVLSVTAAIATLGDDGAWLLLAVATLFATFSTLQGLRMVQVYIGGVTARARLEEAASRINAQRNELNAHRDRLDELIAHTHHLSYYDQLTGLGSRHHFNERMRGTIASHRQNAQRFAVLYLDLDGFKDINETLGHETGDKLLMVVAQRAGALLRNNDFAARLGSDEMALLLHDVDSDEEIDVIAQRCSDAMQVPVKLDNTSICPRVSIGIAVYPDDGDNALALLKAAESAMNASKNDTKLCIARYRPEMSRATEHRLSIEQELRKGLEQGQFLLHYQPQFDARTGKCGGVEALVRWNHPERGMLAPLEFIPIAERTGLIDLLGAWVLMAACRQAVSWFDAGVAPITIAVNISPLQLHDPDLVSTVGNTLAVTGLRPELLELEITESALQTQAMARSTLDQLRELGVRIALDDFGTGYSSLASLRELPIDRVKIDRSFIADTLSNEQDSALLGTIIEMAHILGSTLIAEGVENDAQAQLLRKLRCDCLQGFHFSRPVPAEQIVDIVGSGNRLPTQIAKFAPAFVAAE